MNGFRRVKASNSPTPMHSASIESHIADKGQRHTLGWKNLCINAMLMIACIPNSLTSPAAREW